MNMYTANKSKHRDFKVYESIHNSELRNAKIEYIRQLTSDEIRSNCDIIHCTYSSDTESFKDVNSRCYKCALRSIYCKTLNNSTA